MGGSSRSTTAPVTTTTTSTTYATDSYNTTTSFVKNVTKNKQKTKTKTKDSHDVNTKNVFKTYNTGTSAAPTVPTEAMTAAVTGSTPEAVLNAGGGGVASERTKTWLILAAVGAVALLVFAWIKKK